MKAIRIAGTVLLSVALVGAAACRDVTGPGKGGALSIRPDSVRLTRVGDTVRLELQASRADGSRTSTRGAVWSSSDTTVVRVDPSGLARAVGYGSATVSARLAEHTAEARVAVGERGVQRWEPIHSSLTAEPLTDVWGISDQSIYAVGAGGAVLRWDGARWSRMQTPSSSLRGIWGSSDRDLYAVGTGTVFHFNGETWSALRPPTHEDLNAVWGTGTGEVFAVGGDTRFSRILRWDGKEWTSWGYFKARAYTSVWGSSATDVYVAGGDLLHFDGSGWSLVDGVPRGTFNSVWGLSAQEVYAAGAGGALFRYDGTQWTRIPLETTENLRQVWGSSARDLYVLGDSSLLHYDGSRWTRQMRGEGAFVGRPYAIGGASGRHLFAVGHNGLILRKEQGAWTVMNWGGWLSGVWASPSGRVWAVGDEGMVLHHDGTGWSYTQTGTWSGGRRLVAVDGSSDSNVWAVGISGDVQHYDGSRWRTVPSVPAAVHHGGVWVDDQGRAYVTQRSASSFGENAPFRRAVVRYGPDGATTLWSTLDASYRSQNGIWGRSPEDIYSVSDAGTVLHFDGSRWQETPVAGLVAVWGDPHGAVFAVGYTGRIFRSDGQEWKPMESPTDRTLVGIWGTSESNVYAVGYRALLRFDGTAWSSIGVPGDPLLFAASGTPAGEVYVVGSGGLVLKGET